MRSWLRHHRFAMVDAFRHLMHSPGNFLLNVLAVAVALMLPFSGLTLLENARLVSGQLAVEPEISLFIRADTPRERAQAIAPEIFHVAQQAQHAISVDFVPREKALDALQDLDGLAEAINALGNNPLPDAYVVRMMDFQDENNAQSMADMVQRFKTIQDVEHVRIDSVWVERLAVLLRIMRFALLLFSCTLGGVVVSVVFNTIRLQIMTQREEIAVSRLVGATDAFICRPFYYTGALLGLLSGMVALAMVALSLYLLNPTVTAFAQLYGSGFHLLNLEPWMLSALLAISTALGYTGALLCVLHQLRCLQD